MKSKIYLNLIWWCFIFMAGCINDSEIIVTNWGYQLQNASPKEISKYNFNLVVIDYSKTGEEEGRYSNDEIQTLKDSNIIPICYISIGEAEDYRFYWQNEWFEASPDWLGDENPDWEGNYKVHFWDENWKTIIYSYLDKIIEQGFLGVYLDIVDAFEYWGDDEIEKDINLSEEEAAKKMIVFVKEISDYCRNKTNRDFWIIPQNGERIIDYDTNNDFLISISAIGIEDLFYNEVELISENIRNYRMGFIAEIKKANKYIFSVDYVDDGSGYSKKNKTIIDDYYLRCRDQGFIPYAALKDRMLDEINIIFGLQPND